MGLARTKVLMTKKLPGFEVREFFDVGANVGQTARQALEVFPGSRIQCFEPVPETFEELKTTFSHYDNVKVHNIALSAKKVRRFITADGKKTTNSIVDYDRQTKGSLSIDTLEGHSFMVSNRIEEVDFLKIDTEGHDLDVLVGFSKSLFEQKIHLIQVEAGLHTFNRRHVDLTRFRMFLEPLGYLLFSIDDQVFEKKAHLRRCNAIFVSSAIADRYEIKKV
jgi:FkbM family methyltransferase